jgi:alpha-methylacyl-CoA racemase
MTSQTAAGGPLAGLRVIELAGLGPAPFTAMLLADLGADVVRVDRPDSDEGDMARRVVVNRGRRSIAVDLKTARGAEVVLRLVEQTDVLIEGFRPGVVERLGVGPEQCLERNPRLIYGRITGWGQSGPLATTAGHDINYISLTGLLWATGRPPDKPVPPLNMYGDYGGGALFLAFGVVCALLEAQRSGRGQVIDAAMVDGAASLGATLAGLRATGRWYDERGVNVVDSGYPHYEVYECADGAFVAVGALEEKFYDELVRLTGYEEPSNDRLDPASFAERKKRWAELFLTRNRDEWVAMSTGSDACLTPVLDWNEAVEHPHMRSRGTYTSPEGVVQPAPAPRFSRTPGEIRMPPPRAGEHTDEVLSEAGFDSADVQNLRSTGVVS